MTQKEIISIIEGAIEDAQNPSVKFGTFAKEKKTCLKTVPDSVSKIYKQFYQAKAWPSAQYIILEINDKEAIDNEECVRKWKILAERQGFVQYLIFEISSGEWQMLDGYGQVLAKDNDEIKDYFANFNAAHHPTKGYYQKILFGTPGSGKSYKVAELVKGHEKFTFRTTFHPDSDYSTFVGSYKPVTNDEDALGDTGINEQQLLDMFFQSTKYKNETKARYLYEGLVHTDDINRLGLDSNAISAKLKSQGFQNCAYTTELNLMFTMHKWLHDEGYLTKSDISYKFVPQAFTDAYVAAWQNPEDAVYLVIEEINRGNCAQIFGDLFQLLDRDDEGRSEYPIKADADLKKYLEATLGQGNDGIKDGELRLPSNLNIIATMNTSDQSLFPMDSAFKRRWAWEYVPINAECPDSQFKITIGDKTYKWASFLKLVNDRIHNLSDSEDKQMGNFFIKSDIDVDEFKSKVMFYLWSEVCKEYEKSGSFFKDKNNNDAEFTFNSLFPTNNETNKILQGFMAYLGVEEA